MTAKPPAVEPLIGCKEVAERLGVPLETFYDWRKHGRGPKGYRVGNRVKFKWSQVENWLEQQRETA